MNDGRSELADLVPEMLAIYCRTKQARARATVPAIARALELAEMHLHHALWDAGADVDLNPERDLRPGAGS